MEHHTTIIINDCIKQLTIKRALYMDLPIWEISMDGKNYILQKSANGWQQSSDNLLSLNILNKIGDAIDGLRIKDAS